MSQVTVVNESSYSGDNSLSQTILTFECYRSIIYFPRIEKRRLTFEKQFWESGGIGQSCILLFIQQFTWLSLGTNPTFLKFFLSQISSSVQDSLKTS